MDFTGQNIPMDYTSWGPTGYGNAPSVQAQRRQAMNRFHSNRSGDAMQFIDPWVSGATRIAMQGLIAQGKSPDEARRLAYSTAGGQAAMDAAMMGRRAGMIGQGDPINYANNITRGITSGGFQTDIFGTNQGGRQVSGSGQRVTGQGMLSERVAMNYQRGLIQDLYGSGTPDARKLNGFDMEEASGVFATIARRGGVGRAASWKQGASTQERIDAARDAAVDPLVRDKLSNTSAANNDELQKIIDTTNDPKLKNALKKVHASTDAIVVNSEGRRKVAETVREVTKGMAALSDIYGELSAPELQQKLESISGKRTTNRAQAKASAEMANNLSNAAAMAGMDPRAFGEYAQASQAGFKGRVGAATGLDERSNSLITAINANVHNRTIMDAAGAAQVSQQTEKDAAELGIRGMAGTGRTVDEIQADKLQGREQFMSRYKGMAMVRGGMGSMSGSHRAQAEALMRQFDATTDPSDRQRIEQQLQNLAGNAFGGGKGFAGAAASGMGAWATANAWEGTNGEAMEQAALAGRTAALNTGAMESLMIGGGMSRNGARGMSKNIMKHLGAGGMTDLIRLANQDMIGDQVFTPEERRKQQMDYMTKQAGMSADDALAFADQMFNGDGKLKNADLAGQLASTAAKTSREGGSVAEQRKAAQAALDQKGTGGNRLRVRDDEDKISLKGIANSLLSKKIGGIEDPETMALTLEALQREGVTTMVDETDAEGRQIVDANGKTNKIDLSKGMKTGIDLSGGMTQTALDALTSVNGGKDLGLSKKLGYESNEAMFEATKNDPTKLLAAIKMLTEDEAYLGLNLSGATGNMTAINDATLTSARNAKDGPGKIMSKLAAASALFPSMSEGEQNTLTQSIKDGKDVDLSLFKAGKFDGNVDGGGFDKFWNWGTNKGNDKDGRKFARVENSDRMVDLAGRIESADGSALEGLVGLNKDNALTGQMEQQVKAWKAAKDAGADTVISRDTATGKETTTEIGEAIKQTEASLKKLQEATDAAAGQQSVQKMSVTHLHIENIDDLKK